MKVVHVYLSFSARMEQMKLRHLEDFSTRPPHIPPPQGTSQPTRTQMHIDNNNGMLLASGKLLVEYYFYPSLAILIIVSFNRS